MNAFRIDEQHNLSLTKAPSRMTLRRRGHTSHLVVAAVLAAASVSLPVSPLSAQAAETITAQSAPLAAQAMPRTTKRVVVKAFDAPEADIANWRVVGGEIADMMITGLINNGVDVMERRTIDDAELEAERALNGTVRADTAVAMGQKLGGQVMLVGRVTEFGIEEKGKTIGGGALPIIGFFNKKKTIARVKIDGRLVDIETGRILAAATSEATEEKGSKTVGGLFGAAGVFDSRSGEWTQSMLGKATRKAVDDFAAKIAPRVPAAADVPIIDKASTTERQLMDFNQMPGLPELRKMTCVVLIPETHLTRPRVPDPAAETEITRQLLAAGIPVKDDQRLKQLRDEKWVLEAAHGKLDQTQLLELRNRYGADILIVGEGISERTEKSTLTSNSVICRGRVEVKAIRMDTGSIIAAEAEHQAGRDLSEILSSKDSLKNAGAVVAPRLIASMAQNLAHGAASAETNTVIMELEIGGLSSIKAADQFLTTLGKLPKVKSVDDNWDWKGGVLFARVEVEKNAAKKLGLWMETEASLSRFNIKVQDSNSARVQGTAAKSTAAKSTAAKSTAAKVLPHSLWQRSLNPLSRNVRAAPVCDEYAGAVPSL